MRRDSRPVNFSAKVSVKIRLVQGQKPVARLRQS